MATIYDVDATELIERAAQELKTVSDIKAPVWAVFVKTGVSRERVPSRKDWWYVRAAAVLRSIYKLGPIGVSKLRTKYGGRRNVGHKPDRVYRGSGNIIRKVLQQLEKAGFIAKAQKGVHKGRVITAKGKSFLDKVASSMYKVQLKERKAEEQENAEQAKAAVAEQQVQQNG